MPHVTLPARHRDEDLAIAGTLATLLGSSELYVAWSMDQGAARPMVRAALRDAQAPDPGASPRAGLLRWLRGRSRGR